MQKGERPFDEILAGEKFRETVIQKADAWNHDAPLWHGWVIMDSFLAGIDYARRVPPDSDAAVEARAPTDEEVEAAARAVGDLPCSGGGYVALYPETIRHKLSNELVRIVARAALAAAAKVRASLHLHERPEGE